MNPPNANDHWATASDCGAAMTRKPKTLRCWNGSVGWMRKRDALWDGFPRNGSVTGYVCAESRADARRVIGEYTGQEPPDSEIRDWWCECWGQSMDGIAHERGLWLKFGYGTPIRVV